MIPVQQYPENRSIKEKCNYFQQSVALKSCYEKMFKGSR